MDFECGDADPNLRLCVGMSDKGVSQDFLIARRHSIPGEIAVEHLLQEKPCGSFRLKRELAEHDGLGAGHIRLDLC